MQFFGEAAERGWITESSLIDYKGPASLQEYCKQMVLGTKSKALKKKFSALVQPGRKRSWDIAVASAEEALPLSRQDRKIQFTFDYQIPVDRLPPGAVPASKKEPKDDKKKPTKRKLKEVDTDESQTEGTAPPKKKRRKSKAAALVEQSEAQFAVFCKKRKAGLKEEHPNFTEDEILMLLDQQWKELSPEDQQKFIPMGSDVSKLGVALGSGESLCFKFMTKIPMLYLV